MKLFARALKKRKEDKASSGISNPRLIIIMEAKLESQSTLEKAFRETMISERWEHLRDIDLNQYHHPQDVQTITPLLEEAGLKPINAHVDTQALKFGTLAALKNFVPCCLRGVTFLNSLSPENKEKFVADVVTTYAQTKLSPNGSIEWDSPRLVVQAEKQ